MIVHYKKAQFDLLDFGIEIPLLNARVNGVLANLPDQALKNIFELEQVSNLSREDYLRVHDEGYVERLFSSYPDEEIMKCYELENSDGSFNRYHPDHKKFDFNTLVNFIKEHCEGTYAASKLALKNKFSYFLGGGLHHAYPAYGSGFCLLNDIAITIKKLQVDKLISSALVIDIDAHKGDGTAFIFKNDPNIKTLSIHMKNGWPLTLKNPDVHVKSTLDIEIDLGCEYEYLPRLKVGIHKMFENMNYDLVIVVDGVDAYEKDYLDSAKLIRLSRKQMLERNLFVYEYLKAKNISSLFVTAGGYGEKAYEPTLDFLSAIY